MWSDTEALLNQAIKDLAFPGVAVCVHNGESEIWSHATGAAALVPEYRAVDIETVWDLASVTKVLGTTAVVLQMVDSGQLKLQQPLSTVLDDAPAGVTFAHCLQHSTGWPAWRPFFEELKRPIEEWGSPTVRGEILREVLLTKLETVPGQCHRYSDLGMLALGGALEAMTGCRIDALFQEKVAKPWGIELTWGAPNAAATEDCPVRGRVIQGEVHDLNAAMLGGFAPHAGLFGSVRQTADAAAVFLRSWQGKGPISQELMRMAWSQEGPGSHRIGWDSPSGPNSSASRFWPNNGVGHLGFTGCSVWVAPDWSLIVVMGSNRVHPLVEGGSVPNAVTGPRTKAFRVLRPAMHASILRALGH